MIKAIETQYKGYRFRSRLEARWAVALDALGMRWRYESEGFEVAPGCRYLPDFYLPDWDIYLEVKPDLPQDCFVEYEGKTILEVFVNGSGYTAIGKFLLASEALAKRTEAGMPPRPIHQNRLYMLCGTPGRPNVEKRCGRWVLNDGAVALHLSRPDGQPIFPMNAWCENEHGLDLNTFYLSGPVCHQPNDCPMWPNQTMMGFYVGNGRDYYSPLLKRAFKAARSARFEFGETPH